MEIARKDLKAEISERKINNKKFTSEEILYILIQCLNGIIFLAEHKIFHRDLKPENLLLFEGLDLKVADFGISS